jgi:hypothetical protein
VDVTRRCGLPATTLSRWRGSNISWRSAKKPALLSRFESLTESSRSGTYRAHCYPIRMSAERPWAVSSSASSTPRSAPRHSRPSLQRLRRGSQPDAERRHARLHEPLDEIAAVARLPARRHPAQLPTLCSQHSSALLWRIGGPRDIGSRTSQLRRLHCARRGRFGGKVRPSGRRAAPCGFWSPATPAWRADGTVPICVGRDDQSSGRIVQRRSPSLVCGVRRRCCAGLLPAPLTVVAGRGTAGTCQARPA